MTKVMLADDEPIVRKALQTLPDWEGLGCEIVYAAANGNEVLEHLERCKPDILVTDIKMPGTDGIALAKYIWENKLPIKVIILTAYADFSYAQSAIRYDVMEYITKTGVLNGLEDAVRKCKEQLEELKKAEKNMTESMAEENFFRAVFDGSLYEAEEIRNKCSDFGFDFSQFRILLLFFKMPSDKEKKQWIYKKAEEFLEEAFAYKIWNRLFVKRDMLCVILQEKEKEQDALTNQCREISKMIKHFLGVETALGYSSLSQGAQRLHGAYQEAEGMLKKAMERDISAPLPDRQEEREPEEIHGGRKDLVEECSAYIKTHYETCLTVSEIAVHIGTSASYLSRIFKETTGNTIIATINAKKLQKAKEYLEQTDKKVYEIADLLGFENVTYFSHFFKKQTGIAPKDWKNR